MRNALLWMLTGLTLILGCAGMVAWDRWMMATADACDGRACVWIYDPVVAPGGTVTVTAGVYDGVQAGIEEVRVRGPGVDVGARGDGATWGGSISTRGFQRGHDSVDVRVPIPVDRETDAPLPLEVELTWVAAVPTLLSRNTFGNEVRSARVTVPLTVRSPSDARLRRAAWFLAAAGALLVGTGICWVGLRQLRAVDGSGDDHLGEAAGGAVVILSIGWGLVGWLVFSRPLQAAFDLPSTALSVAAILGWISLTGAGAWRLDRVRLRIPYQLRLREAMAREQVERWLRRLRDEGVEVRTVPGVVVLTRGEDRIWLLRVGFRRGQVPILGEGDDLLFLAALCVARGVGPLELTVHGVGLPVTPDDTVDALREALDAQFRERMEALQEMLQRTGEVIDRLRPHLDPSATRP